MTLGLTLGLREDHRDSEYGLLIDSKVGLTDTVGLTVENELCRAGSIVV